jgi:hypothetical protein
MGYLEARKKADIAFARYIVARDLQGEIYAPCVSCRRYTPKDELECGHYEDRACMALRFDEENCNAQCAYPCNRARSRAVKEAYAMELKRKYGQDVLDRLWDKRKQTKCYSVADLEELTILYRNKLKDL